VTFKYLTSFEGKIRKLRFKKRESAIDIDNSKEEMDDNTLSHAAHADSTIHQKEGAGKRKRTVMSSGDESGQKSRALKRRSLINHQVPALSPAPAPLAKPSKPKPATSKSKSKSDESDDSDDEARTPGTPGTPGTPSTSVAPAKVRRSGKGTDKVDDPPVHGKGKSKAKARCVHSPLFV
jgi:hypothetical protein